MNVRKLTLCELKDKFTKGEVSAVEIVKAYCQRVLLVESKVKAYITTAKKDALVKEADELDFTLSKWRKTMPLMAMPIAVKDNICTKGVKTTCGSRMLENFVPPYDATVVARMKEHGYYLIGKTNMDEFAMGSSTETSAFGPITKDVRDAAMMMQVIAGHDPLDSTSADVPVPDYMKALKENLRGMKVGVPLEFFAEGLDPEVELAVRTAIIQMQAIKAEIKEVSLPMTKYAIAAYYLIATAEASSNLARYDGVRYGHRAKEKGLLEMYMKTRQEGFGAEVKRRIMLGTYALSAGYYDAYYGKAQAVRTLIKRDFNEAFKEVDVIVTPTMPARAFKLGEKSHDPLQMYLSDIYTISVNLAGLPAISLPCGLSSGKLPIGLQIIGRPFEEEKVLRAAYAYEQATEWHLKRPGL